MGSTLRPAQLADLDADGRLDLVAHDGARIATWLGDGTGALSEGPAFVTSIVAELVAIDLDGDGRADLVTRDTPLGDEGSTVRVRLGAGDGTFGAPLPLAGGATALAVADVDGNGAPDVVLGDRSGLSVKIFFGAGDGTFAAPGGNAIVAIGNVVTGIAVGDLDGDGHRDLVVTAGQTFDRPASFAARVRGSAAARSACPSISSGASERPRRCSSISTATSARSCSSPPRRRTS